MRDDDLEGKFKSLICRMFCGVLGSVPVLRESAAAAGFAEFILNLVSELLLTAVAVALSGIVFTLSVSLCERSKLSLCIPFWYSFDEMSELSLLICRICSRLR